MSGLSCNTNVDGLRPRAYQLEMLEASLRENIIVAMDTGSGKTQIAILRIFKELETCPTGKIVWFLTPTVALCEQQYKALCMQLPNERTKLLVGRDNVDRWSLQYWDVALSRVRIAVSTHAVLADALGHGFVTMARLALLVFDEAHHCIGNHPANKIMKDFYHCQASPSGFVCKPKILGLTASPTIRSRPKDIRVIEANLDSVIRTPCIHREELIQHVHIPELLQIHYFEDRVDAQTWCPILKSLVFCIEDTDERLKNHVLRLLSEDEIARLPANDIKRRKWTSQEQYQLRRFSDRAQYIQKELGPWASDYYITESIKKMTQSVLGKQNGRLDWQDEPKIHILNTLGKLHVSEHAFKAQCQTYTEVSNKCAKVLNFLRNQASSSFRGIIFVDQRVTAFVLSHLLSVYSETKNFFQCGTFVGISTNDCKKMELRDLLDPQDQQNTLKDFREGRKNLLIATTALEEGIDISACNFVICFNRPPNLKSFLQRRGRARQANSKIVLMSSLNNKADAVVDWEKKEAEMIAEYMSNDRNSAKGEIISLDEVINDTRILRVDSTGAKITLDEALKHLYHFCQQLRAAPGTNNLPIFVFEMEKETGFFRAQVTLPNSVHRSVRRASSLRAWSTEYMARKDAAFEAYIALYNAGLLNDHLLPLLSGDMLREMDGIEDSSSIVEIPQRYNPWHDIAKKWSIPGNCYWNRVNIRWAEHGTILVNLILPVDIPSFQWPLPLLLDGIEYECSMSVSKMDIETEILDPNILRSATKMILHCFAGRCPTDYPDDFVALFIPHRASQQIQGAEKFTLFAPFVMRRLEILLVGKELRDRLLPKIHFRNWDLLAEAISATSARELSNNKRLAFLGGTVLEFLVTKQLFANHGIWPAGYLSAKKNLVISNSHLSRMALDVGLDKFMITDPFNPSTWKPPCISDVIIDDVENTRSVSKETLADGVGALIGAAYLDGEYEEAFECARIFLSEIMAQSVGYSFSPTLPDHDQGNPIHFAPTHFALLEELIGYKFRNSALLAEAMTHPSYDQDLTVESYERLAFLGNAVLSMVIIESLCHEKQPLSRNQMHLLRTATINNDFLAFTCLETCMEKEYMDVQQCGLRTFTEIHCGKSIALWGFLRYGNPELAEERSNFLVKHAETLQGIRQRLEFGREYPWLELAKLEPYSELSDVVQALFGAVFYDSNGDMKRCVLLAENLQILSILRQLMRRKVDILHPKTRLQELAGNQQVTYLARMEPPGDTHGCVIKMNGNVIAEARDGSCREEIVIRAAELAIKSLEVTNRNNNQHQEG